MLYYGQSVRGSAVTEAEVKFGYFLGEHHLAFKLADHATKLFSSMFPDSAITKDFKCGRSKATASPSILLHRMLGEALKQLSGILSISAFKQMILQIYR